MLRLGLRATAAPRVLIPHDANSVLKGRFACCSLTHEQEEGAKTRGGLGPSVLEQSPGHSSALPSAALLGEGKGPRAVHTVRPSGAAGVGAEETRCHQTRNANFSLCSCGTRWAEEHCGQIS